MTKVGHIELFVKDTQNSKKFYVDILGFELEEEQGNGQFIWLKSGNFLLLLRPGSGSDRGDNYQSASSGMVIYTDELEETKKELESRGLKFHGTDGSQSCLTFKDPDGNWLQLVNPEHS